MKIKVNRYLFSVLMIFVVFACSDGLTKKYNKNIEFAGNLWNATDTAEFKFKIDNSDKKYRLVVGFHTTDQYNFSNIWFFTKHNLAGKSKTDTLEFTMADISGKWYGDHSGEEVNTYIMFADSLKLEKGRDYSLKLVQAMRRMNLSEVKSVSLSVLEHSK